ncbi:MAG TPA: NIPSNAP family protein [Bryobacteraceae bacterium]|nr:NIPSNAP family protein [Bryobacteraceae bacterium]
MNPQRLLLLFAATGIFAGGYWTGSVRAAADRVYELRVYHTYPGKLDDLLARFRNHTMAIFERHGMKNVGYWTPLDEPEKSKTLYYIISHESRDQAKSNWNAFRNDPEWKKVQTASEANGKLVEKVDDVYLSPTDFSPLK